MRAIRLTDIFNVAQVLALADAAEPAKSIVVFKADHYMVALRLFEDACASLGLTSTGHQARQAVKTLRESMERNDGPTVMWDGLRPELVQLGIRYHQEIGNPIAYHLSPEESNLFNHSLAGWEDAADRFENAADDIEEANRCLALERPTAAAFHIMRVAEWATHYVGKRVGAKFTDPNMGAMIQAINNRLDEMRLTKKGLTPRALKTRLGKIDFYAQTAAHLKNIKDCWRNKTNHIGKTYTQSEAEMIVDHVKTLMQMLAEGP